jgi:hypothetical protein
MRLAVKVVCPHHLNHAVEGSGVEQNATEYRFLGIKALGGNFSQGVFKNGHSVLRR